MLHTPRQDVPGAHASHFAATWGPPPLAQMTHHPVTMTCYRCLQDQAVTPTQCSCLQSPSHPPLITNVHSAAMSSLPNVSAIPPPRSVMLMPCGCPRSLVPCPPTSSLSLPPPARLPPASRNVPPPPCSTPRSSRSQAHIVSNRDTNNTTHNQPHRPPRPDQGLQFPFMGGLPRLPRLMELSMGNNLISTLRLIAPGCIPHAL